MGILDEVQEKLRDPRHSDHVSRATETELLNEHNYTINVLRIRDAKLATYAWLNSRQAAEVLRGYAGQCVLASVNRVVGHGRTWDEAYEMAAERGLTYRETVELGLEDTPAVL